MAKRPPTKPKAITIEGEAWTVQRQTYWAPDVGGGHTGAAWEFVRARDGRRMTSADKARGRAVIAERIRDGSYGGPPLYGTAKSPHHSTIKTQDDPGLASYRLRSPSGRHILIGARTHAEAMSEAARSTPAPKLADLEIWNGNRFVRASASRARAPMPREHSTIKKTVSSLAADGATDRARAATLRAIREPTADSHIDAEIAHMEAAKAHRNAAKMHVGPLAKNHRHRAIEHDREALHHGHEAVRCQARRHSTIKKTPAQLESEIARALHQRQTRSAAKRYPAQPLADVGRAWAAPLRSKRY